MSARPDLVDRRARVLIVDDERSNRQVLEVMLAPEGFELLTAASGEEALALVASHPPDLILLDVMMPGMDGNRVAARIKGDPVTRNIPIIMVTALNDRGSRLQGLNAGAEDFLAKPVDRVELGARVKNLLRLKAYGDYHDRYSHALEEEVGSRVADLAESEARFRQLAEAMREVYFLVDPKLARCLYVSPAYEDIFGRSCASLYADPRSWTACIHADDRAHALAEILPGSTLAPHDVEYRIVRPDGRERYIRSRGFPIRDGDGVTYRFAASAEDVTERKALEAQVRQASKMEGIGRLASGVAHDFNNLLSIILSYSEMLTNDLAGTDPMRADLEEISRAALRAAALTQQLLAFSRQQVLQPKVVDLSEVVGGMETMLRRLLGEDVELTAVTPPLLAKILVDPGQMEQVIMNLVINARDAMPRGGKLTVETAEVVLDEGHAAEHVGVSAGAHVMLAVSDTGVGMDKATQARMFEPFFTTKEVGKGTGLGLATVFGIIRQSGGTIWVYSEPGMGTTFKVYFPTVVGERRVDEPLAPWDSGTTHGTETILVVEDEERVRVLTCAILRKHGYNVLEAQSGGDALLLCEQHAETIDLLLTDVVMPRMSGRQLAERLSPIRPDMKVIYMSGYTDDAVVRHGVLESTVAFLQKPLTPKKLLCKVREVLDSTDRS